MGRYGKSFSVLDTSHAKEPDRIARLANVLPYMAAPGKCDRDAIV